MQILYSLEYVRTSYVEKEITLLDKVSLLPTIRASMTPLSDLPEFAEARDEAAGLKFIYRRVNQ